MQLDAKDMTAPNTVRGSKQHRLSDPAWLTRMYREHGDMWIALELGCNRKTVTAARDRHGIQSAPRGPRRGSSSTPPTELTAATVHPADIRYEQERRARGPAPTETLLIAQIRAMHDAHLAGHRHAYDDALLALSSAAKLVYDHRQRLKAA